MQPERYEAWYATRRLAAPRGARWHTPAEALRLFDDLPVRHAGLGTAIAMSGGKRWSRCMEPLLRRWLPGCGVFIAVAADTRRFAKPGCPDRRSGAPG